MLRERDEQREKEIEEDDMKKSDKQVEKEFNEIITEKMTDDQFWNWVSSWKDSASIVEEAQEWSINTKRAELPKLKKMI